MINTLCVTTKLQAISRMFSSVSCNFRAHELMGSSNTTGKRGWSTAFIRPGTILCTYFLSHTSALERPRPQVWTLENNHCFVDGLYFYTTRSLHIVCTSLFILLFIKSQYTVFCTSYLFCTFFILLHILLFISLFVLIFIYIYIYMLPCCVTLIFFCTVHWADLTWFTFHFWLYPA